MKVYHVILTPRLLCCITLFHVNTPVTYSQRLGRLSSTAGYQRLSTSVVQQQLFPKLAVNRFDTCTEGKTNAAFSEAYKMELGLFIQTSFYSCLLSLPPPPSIEPPFLLSLFYLSTNVFGNSAATCPPPRAAASSQSIRGEDVGAGAVTCSACKV